VLLQAKILHITKFDMRFSFFGFNSLSCLIRSHDLLVQVAHNITTHVESPFIFHSLMRYFKLLANKFDVFQGKDEFMGRCTMTPLVKLNGQGPPAPRLLWYDVHRGNEYGGEILAAFELFLVSGCIRVHTLNP